MVELLHACEHDRDVAELQIQRTKQFLDRETEPGPERERQLIALSRYRADFAHWASYCSYYRLRCDREGPDAVPSMAGRDGVPTLPLRKPVAPANDPRLPRESDDSGEEPPF